MPVNDTSRSVGSSIFEEFGKIGKFSERFGLGPAAVYREKKRLKNLFGKMEDKRIAKRGSEIKTPSSCDDLSAKWI